MNDVLIFAQNLGCLVQIESEGEFEEEVFTLTCRIIEINRKTAIVTTDLGMTIQIKLDKIRRVCFLDELLD